MKVYVLIFDYEGYDMFIEAIFSSMEKALTCLDKRIKEYNECCECCPDDRVECYDDYLKSEHLSLVEWDTETQEQKVVPLCKKGVE